MRIVVKVGTRLVTNEDHTLSEAFLKKLAAELAELFEEGHELCLVTSGAVSAGRGILCPREKKSIPYRQVLAAVGQGMLIDRYREAFSGYGIHVAQALLTSADFTNKGNFLNTQRVFELLMRERILPIVNENDVTAMAELTFGDNDMLGAKTAAMVSADLLILLTSVDGLFTDDPHKNPDATLMNIVSKIDEKLFGMAKSATNKDSIGGMDSKVRAAKYAMECGVAVFIGNGIKTDICREAVKRFLKNRETGGGTFFLPVSSKIQSFKKWLKPNILKGAEIMVDSRAAKILRQEGKSLLSAGITGIKGDFSRGDVITVVDPDKKPLAYGQVNYGSRELQKINGKKSSEIEKMLGFSYEEEVIHRDHMVVLDGR